MKINKKTSKKKNILISAVIIALAFLALVIFFIKKDYFLNIFEETSVNDSTINEVVIDNNPPTQEQIDAGQIQKEESNEQPNNDLGVSITYIDISSNEVVINSVISGIVTSNGVCYLALSSGENLVTKESSTYALPSSSTCMGFTINKSELRTGTWQVELSVLANDKTSKVYDEFILE